MQATLELCWDKMSQSAVPSFFLDFLRLNLWEFDWIPCILQSRNCCITMQAHPEQQPMAAYGHSQGYQAAPAGDLHVGPASGVGTTPIPYDKFAHLRHLPMFPLVATEDGAAIAKTLQSSARIGAGVQPLPQFNAAEKVFMHASGLDTVFQVKRAENALIKTAAASTAMTASQMHTAVLTRWAVYDGSSSSTVIVDVYQIRPVAAWMGSPFLLKANVDVKLLVGGKWEIKLKRGKNWSKTWTRTPMESLSIVAELGAPTQLDLEIVQRAERPIAPVETPQVKKRFEAWVIPS
jgi:hypothetical protein